MAQYITNSQVFGMRCSGTNYVEELIRLNFPKLKVMPTTLLDGKSNYGWKHGDVGSGYTAFPKGINRKPLTSSVRPLDWRSSDNTLLIVVYRNLFDWLRSLQKTPHHAHEFENLPIDEFVKRPWRAYFSPPEHIDDRYLAELYDSVLDMRQAKVSVFESFQHRFKNVAYINYESVVFDPAKILSQLSEVYNLKSIGKFKNSTKYKGSRGQSSGKKYSQKKYPPIDSRTLRHIIKNTDWKKERMIGYHLSKSAYLKSFLKEAQENPEKLIRHRGKLRTRKSSTSK